MSKVEEFLSRKDEEEVIEAIRMAEKSTSGEIRVHLEKSHGDQDIFERSMEVFHVLKMDNTKAANGVLIYVAVEDRDFVIYGDRGINEVVPTDFWESTKDAIVAQFKTGNYKQGLIDGILKAGEQLQRHFPWSETNVNELSNTISRGNATNK
ncbi:MAG TPA: TPM domain-containing protein [Gillisia sp.]|nr:TPM domain-containing protein [Gillisia sp.]